MTVNTLFGWPLKFIVDVGGHQLDLTSLLTVDMSKGYLELNTDAVLIQVREAEAKIAGPRPEPATPPEPETKLDDRYVHLRLIAHARGPKVRQNKCHVFDSNGVELGVLPASKITTVMDYNIGHPVVSIEIIGESVDMETLHPSQPSPADPGPPPDGLGHPE